MTLVQRIVGLRLALAVLVAGALSGCAGPRTTVVLLPDEDGHVGAVVVSGGGASQRIDRAYHRVVVAPRRPASAAGALDEDAVGAGYGPLLAAQPSRPLVFVVNFLLDSSTLTESSRARLPEIVEAVRARQPTEVIVYGHADAIGPEAHNDRLSAERARAVADLLRRGDPALEHVEVHACGDRQPAVPSATRGAEPRNRRAEVVIL